MVLKNLLRRKGRTVLTILGVSIGIAVIITLGSLADGLEAGYQSILAGSTADMILADADSYDLTLSSIDESIGPELQAMPEIDAAAGMLQGLVQTEGNPYFFVFGYPQYSFPLERFQIIDGVHLNDPESERQRGTPMILGSAAAEAMSKSVGDTLRLGDSSFRVVGIYQSGEALEDGGSVILMQDAQELLGMQRHVSAYYIQLESDADVDHLKNRIQRLYSDLSLSTGEDLAENNQMTAALRAMVWGIAALAIIIGGVSTMNAQLMSVLERTHEIGVLRAVGWQKWRVMVMVLGESLAVSLLGGALGFLFGWGLLNLTEDALAAYGTSTSVSLGLMIQAFSVVFVLGLVGGLYPAYRASQLQPIEALRYEGGSTGKNSGRLPVGGMAIRNLWRRKARTFMTLGVIGLTVGAIMALNGMLLGMMDMMSDMGGSSEIILRKRDASDTSYSFIDERVGDRIRTMDGVEHVSGMTLSIAAAPDAAFIIALGYHPRQAAIREFNIVEGERIYSNSQIMIGRSFAESQNLRVGDVMVMGERRFRVMGIYEHSLSFYEMGGVVTLRDAQQMTGHLNKVTLFMVDTTDNADPVEVTTRINERFPEVQASLTGEFAEAMPDMEAARAMSDAVAYMAILVGGFGMMNTMLMSVLERTREIGVLRALGWRRRAILSLIMRESLTLGILGALVGIGVAFLMIAGLQSIPTYGEFLTPRWTPEVVIQSISVALLLSLAGGLWPAFRATRLQPVEALRYE
jgi:putative ABC transport system permease protein